MPTGQVTTGCLLLAVVSQGGQYLLGLWGCCFQSMLWAREMGGLPVAHGTIPMAPCRVTTPGLGMLLANRYSRNVWHHFCL